MSVKVYPVTKTQDACEDYEVYVNGVKVELNTARVSAYPYNRRWPGHQRQIEQTELINFLSMQSDEEVELTIVPKNPSYVVRIRPRSLALQARTDANGIITICVNGTAQFTVEPYGRSRALHVFIDPISCYELDKNGENVLYFGAGEHNVGDLYLQSGQTLYLDEGAVVYGTIFGLHAENIKILGRGILDNSRNKEKILFEMNEERNQTAVENAEREHAINFVCCKNVGIDGITIRDPLVYTINSLSCENIRVNNIKLIGCWRFNSDGVHFVNCTNGSLTNSFLRTYDDSICVRGFANYDYDRFLSNENEDKLSFVCQNILIKNCVVWNDWGKNLQVGTETYAKEVKDVTFEDCKLIHTTGMAVAIWLVDNAKIHDVVFKDIIVEYEDYMLKNTIQGTDEDVYIDIHNVDYGGSLVHFEVSKHFEYSLIKTEQELGSIQGVWVKNLQLYSVQKPYFVFIGDNSKSMCEDITFENIYWNGELVSKRLFEKQTQKNQFVQNITFIEKTSK